MPVCPSSASANNLLHLWTVASRQHHTSSTHGWQKTAFTSNNTAAAIAKIGKKHPRSVFAGGVDVAPPVITCCLAGAGHIKCQVPRLSGVFSERK